MRNEEAFRQYCKTAGRTLFQTVKPAKATSLFVRFEPSFPGHQYNFNADKIAIGSGVCERFGLEQIEGRYNGRFIQGVGYEPEFRRYELCGPPVGKVIPEPSAKYELVIGKVASKIGLPWGGEWVSKSSAQIVDSSTGEVLAEDTLYFDMYDKASAGCRTGLDTLTSLIQSVFGNPNPKPNPAAAPTNVTVLKYDP